jgi:hypothetical protein
MHPGTLQTMTSTETWKWKLCLAKSRDLHKRTNKKTPPSWERWGHTAAGQYGHSAQTAEGKNLLNYFKWQCKSRDSARVSVSVKTETVLLCQCKSRDNASASVSVRAETVLVQVLVKSKDSVSVKAETVLE